MKQFKFVANSDGCKTTSASKNTSQSMTLLNKQTVHQSKKKEVIETCTKPEQTCNTPAHKQQTIWNFKIPLLTSRNTTETTGSNMKRKCHLEESVDSKQRFRSINSALKR